jgi:hypothetical protein
LRPHRALRVDAGPVRVVAQRIRAK